MIDVYEVLVLDRWSLRSVWLSALDFFGFPIVGSGLDWIPWGRRKEFRAPKKDRVLMVFGPSDSVVFSVFRSDSVFRVFVRRVGKRLEVRRGTGHSEVDVRQVRLHAEAEQVWLSFLSPGEPLKKRCLVLNLRSLDAFWLESSGSLKI